MEVLKEIDVSPQATLKKPARFAAQAKKPASYDLSRRLVRFGRQRSYVTLGDGCENLFVVGGAGSCKSTSTVFTLGKALFSAGCGGYGFGVKYRARDETYGMAWEAGRAGDVIDFGPGSGQRFNWIDYESKIHGPGNAIVDNLMNVFVSSTEVISRKMGLSQSEPYWEHSWRQMMKVLLFLDLHGNGGVDFLRVLQMCQTMPRGFTDLENWRDHASLVTLHKAMRNCPSSQSRSMQLAKDYMTEEMPRLSDRTRSCIQQMCSAMLDSHVRDLYQEAFGGESTWTPDDVMDRGKILICSFDIERFEAVGQLINSIVKKCAQRALARRREKFGSDMGRCRPVAFIMDEAPFLIDSQDERFLRVGRENRAVVLAAIQSIPSMVDELGGGEVARNRVDGILSHVHTKFMHQNDCDVSNNRMSDIIAKDIWWRKGTNEGEKDGGGRHEGSNWTQQVDYVLPPIAFKQLKRGGAKANWDVRAIVTMPGYQWPDGKWWQAIKMIQNCEPKKDHVWSPFLHDHSPATMWFDDIPIARIWVKHVPFLQLLRDLWRKPKAAKWLYFRWLAFWVGVEASSGIYEECDREIDNAD
jgi:hypothetical protein